MITEYEGRTGDYFHLDGECRIINDKKAKSGKRLYTPRFRRNGKTKTWIRDPRRYRTPVKYGMFGGYDAIINGEEYRWHTEDSCPVAAEFAALKAY
jgi:hypothetical protein